MAEDRCTDSQSGVVSSSDCETWHWGLGEELLKGGIKMTTPYQGYVLLGGEKEKDSSCNGERQTTLRGEQLVY